MSNKTRLYLADSLFQGKIIYLSDNNAHYLRNVLRVKTHSQIQVFNYPDGQWKAEVKEISKNQITITILEETCKASSLEKLSLIFAPTKHLGPQFIIEKATELGVTDIYPIKTKNTVIDKVNLAKLEITAIEATQQCERFSPPRIYQMQSFESIIRNKPFSGKLYACMEREVVKPIYQAFFDLHRDDNALLVGPEGGFTADEKDILQHLDWVVPISLGKRILRAETACVTVISVYQAKMDTL